MTTIAQIDNKIEELQKEKEELLEKEKHQSKMDWIKIPRSIIKDWDISVDNKYDYEISELTHLNMTWKEQNTSLKESEEIASYKLLQLLRNENIDKRFIKFWANVPNPDKISKDNNPVAGFYADSVGAVLDGWDPTDADASLGVFVIRKKSKRSK